MNKRTKIVAFIGKADYVQTAYSDLKGEEDIVLIGLSCFDYYRLACEKLHVKPLTIIYCILSLYFVIRYCSVKKNIVFLFHGVNYLWMFDIPLLTIARKRKNVKVVGYFWDVIDFEKYSVPDYLYKYDISFIIDEQLAEKYGCEYYPIFYSKEDTITYPEECDVFFCGEDGGRLGLLESVYAQLTSIGLKCVFYCSKSSFEDQTINGIKHIKQMPHSQYISRIKACKIILDIVKPGVSCCSLRFCEGVIYDKKVLTNNPSILKQTFYNTNQFSVFEKADSIDQNFLMDELSVSLTNKYEVSPKRFIDVIRDRLNLKPHSFI